MSLRGVDQKVIFSLSSLKVSSPWAFLTFFKSQTFTGKSQNPTSKFSLSVRQASSRKVIPCDWSHDYKVETRRRKQQQSRKFRLSKTNMNMENKKPAKLWRVVHQMEKFVGRWKIVEGTKNCFTRESTITIIKRVFFILYLCGTISASENKTFPSGSV